MALVRCPECQRQMSDTAPSCPHCGYTLTLRGAESGRSLLEVTCDNGHVVNITNPRPGKQPRKMFTFKYGWGKAATDYTKAWGGVIDGILGLRSESNVEEVKGKCPECGRVVWVRLFYN